jgi:hypothetical protein
MAARGARSDQARIEIFSLICKKNRTKRCGTMVGFINGLKNMRI